MKDAELGNFLEQRKKEIRIINDNVLREAKKLFIGKTIKVIRKDLGDTPREIEGKVKDIIKWSSWPGKTGNIPSLEFLFVFEPYNQCYVTPETEIIFL
jgi:hypothetical protein